MFKIVRFPRRLEKFFRNQKDRFLWEHFEYFRMLVLLIAFAHGRRNVSRCAATWIAAAGHTVRALTTSSCRAAGTLRRRWKQKPTRCLQYWAPRRVRALT